MQSFTKTGFLSLTFLALSACSSLPSKPLTDLSTITVQNKASTLPKDWQHGGMMEIFVRGFNDSDNDGTGDLKGITQKLDYLKSLGIKGIWLMPINPSEDRDHGYAVTDYRAIEPAYGTLADFDELIREAHARGIGVIMDYVINHSASKHPLFLDSLASKDSAYRDWFVWRDVAPKGWEQFGHDPWVTKPSGAYLAQFDHTMPEWNLQNPKVLQYHLDSLRFWLNRGVDGFRFDAVAHLVENGPKAMMDQPENLPILREIRKAIEAYDNRYMVCEATGDPAGYGAANNCGSAFAFSLNGNVIKAAKGEPAAIAEVAQYWLTANPRMASLLANHDEFAGLRLWDQFQGQQKPYRLAIATLLLQPGIPFIYYGEEIGMNAGAGLKGDPSLRSPMPWSAQGFSSAKPFRALPANAESNNLAAQWGDPDSLVRFYQRLFKLRNEYPALSHGSYGQVVVNGSAVQFVRTQGEQRVLVVINYGMVALDATAWATHKVLFNSEANAGNSMAGQSVRVYQLP
jgi:alpha-amylase